MVYPAAYARYTPKFGYRVNAVFTIVAVLSSEEQRKTAAEQRAFCCFLGRPIARGPGFLRNSTPRSLIILWKNSENSETQIVHALRITQALVPGVVPGVHTLLIFYSTVPTRIPCRGARLAAAAAGAIRMSVARCMSLFEMFATPLRQCIYDQKGVTWWSQGSARRQ
jgi:hypothetical protein